MNPPLNRSSLPRPSGLPRPSRLPVAQSLFEPPVPKIPSSCKRNVTAVRPRAARDAVIDPASSGGNNIKTSKSENLEEARIGDSIGSPGELESRQETVGNGDGPTIDKEARRRPRPSLSDRTIETLSQIPPSPSPRRRRSSFFPSESPAATPSRPKSSLSRSRPATSHGQRPPIPPIPSMAPRATSPIKRPTSTVSTKTTPNRRAVSSYVPKSLPHTSNTIKGIFDTTPSKTSRPTNSTVLRSANGNSISKSTSKPIGASKTYAARSSQPRPVVGDAFVKPAMPSKGAKSSNFARRDLSSTSADSAPSIDSHFVLSPTSHVSSRTSQASNDGNTQQKVTESPQSKSSAALREAIAKAKAERRKAAGRPESRSGDYKADDRANVPATSDSLVFRKRIDQARIDGRLNIAAMGLSEFPREVLTMYDLDTLNTSSGAWYESVDIRRLNAAENELQDIDEMFPDRSAEELRHEDDETEGTIFGGLEILDLHGNSLQHVPVGLRQLQHLTILNLSKNRLSNDSVGTLSQITSLKELRIAENALKGTLPEVLYGLRGLEILDVHGNAISELSDGIRDLGNLRILDMASNQLRSFPLQAIENLPLSELNLGRNRLAGSLFSPGFAGLSFLKSLDVSGNALTSICDDGPLDMPQLHSFYASDNRLTTLPDISGWTNLTVLSASNNNVAVLPEGMTSLTKLRNIDFTGNNLKKLDDQIGMMEDLTSLTIANNPMRERRFLSMATDDIKRELRNRLVPAESQESLENPDPDTEYRSHDVSAGAALPVIWQLKPGGVLDRSSTSLHSISASELEHLQPDSVRSFIAHHNLLSSIPTSIILLASNLSTLDLSHNKLSGTAYLSEQLVLPRLRDLNLASNTITSLIPLSTFLAAPQLQSLKVSYNRLTAIPALRSTYPDLATLLASDNAISELRVDSVRGLQVCDVSRNNIAHLEPRLGLLEGEELRMLGVEGNCFRVPRRDVVDNGTGAILRWLRDRIPLE